MNMRRQDRAALPSLIFVFFLMITPGATAQTTPAWPAISKDDLELKDNPMHPGDAAMVLYREVDTNNAKSIETHFTRIKIFQEQGKKYGDIEIPYFADESHVEDIHARTVAPDGQATEFVGSIFDKVLVKTKRLTLSAKTFTLSNVQAGSILEYWYTLHLHESIPDAFKNPGHYYFHGGYAYPASRWTVQGKLFVRRARFVLHPFARNAHLEIRVLALPKIGEPQHLPDGSVALEVENVPGIHEEEYSPPEAAMRAEICFFYVVGLYFDERFWGDMAELEVPETEKFISRSKVVQQEVNRLVSSGDPPETKLRKLYERAQQIRAVSAEPAKTEKERESENLKPNKTVEDVLTRGYAFGDQINLVFVALARAAGFNAYPLRVATRNRDFFHSTVPDPRQLDAGIVEVQLPDKKLFLDPATPHCPFGLLPWEETDTDGVRLAQFDAGLVQVPPPASKDALIERKAAFRLDKDGNLQGKLEVSFLGQEALLWRTKENNRDETDRKKDLEEETKSWMPQGATATLTSMTGWEGSDGPVHAVFDVQASSFGAEAGDRLMVPVMAFRLRSTDAFKTSSRENPVYLQYGHQENDEMTVEIPEGFQLENLPVPRGMQTVFSSYEFSSEQHGKELRFRRNFVMNKYYFRVEHYPLLRDFYDFVRANDEEQAILHVLPAN